LAIGDLDPQYILLQLSVGT